MGEPDRPRRPTSRRRAGPAANDWPPPTLLSEVKSNPASILLFVVSGPYLVWMLARWTAESQSAVAWASGALGVVVALLVLASFVLRFLPAVLWHEAWARSPLRRGLQVVLIWAWLIAIMFAAVLVSIG